MGDWATDEGEAGREGFDSHLVIWSVGLTQFPDQALFPNKLAVLDLRYNKITRCPGSVTTLTQKREHTRTHVYMHMHDTGSQTTWGFLPTCSTWT